MPDLYSSQNGIVSNGYPALNPKLAIHAQGPAIQGIQVPPQLSNMGIRNGIPSGMQVQQQRAPGIQSAGMQQHPGMQQGSAVPQVAYKQGSFGKVNAGRIQGLPMQGIQMQQQQLQDVSFVFNRTLSNLGNPIIKLKFFFCTDVMLTEYEEPSAPAATSDWNDAIGWPILCSSIGNFAATDAFVAAATATTTGG